jgi:hypothetical protein
MFPILERRDKYSSALLASQTVQSSTKYGHLSIYVMKALDEVRVALT